MNVRDAIIQWMADPENNFLEPGSSLHSFDKPLVGIASGADPLFNPFQLLIQRTRLNPWI